MQDRFPEANVDPKNNIALVTETVYKKKIPLVK